MAVHRVTIGIVGFGWRGSGALTVERAISHLPGVLRTHVNPDTEMAYLEYDPGKLCPEELVRAVREAGFDVEGPPSFGWPRP